MRVCVRVHVRGRGHGVRVRVHVQIWRRQRHLCGEGRDRVFRITAFAKAGAQSFSSRHARTCTNQSHAVLRPCGMPACRCSRAQAGRASPLRRSRRCVVKTGARAVRGVARAGWLPPLPSLIRPSMGTARCRHDLMVDWPVPYCRYTTRQHAGAQLMISAGVCEAV